MNPLATLRAWREGVDEATAAWTTSANPHARAAMQFAALVAKTDLFARAAAMAFFALLSLPPLLVAAFGIASWVGAEPDALQIQMWVGRLETSTGLDLSTVDPVARMVELVERARRLGPAALILALVTGSRSLRTLQDTWVRPGATDDGQAQFGFVLSRFMASFTLLLLLAAFLVARVLGEVGSVLLQSVPAPADAAVHFLASSVFVIAWDGALLLGAFVVVLQLGSKGHVKWMNIARGAGCWLLSLLGVSVLWRVYLTWIADFDRLYGGMASVVAGLVWLYLFCASAVASLLVSRAYEETAKPSAPGALDEGSTETPPP